MDNKRNNGETLIMFARGKWNFEWCQIFHARARMINMEGFQTVAEVVTEKQFPPLLW